MPLTPPSGKVVAYAKFLAIYKEMLGVGENAPEEVIEGLSISVFAEPPPRKTLRSSAPSHPVEQLRPGPGGGHQPVPSILQAHLDLGPQPNGPRRLH